MLPDRQAFAMQLSITQHAASDVQRRPVGEGLKTAFQPFDHRHFGVLSQCQIGRLVKAMQVRQRCERLQAVFRIIGGDRRLREIARVPGEPAHLLGHPFHQVAYCLLTQPLTIPTGFAGNVQSRLKSP